VVVRLFEEEVSGWCRRRGVWVFGRACVRVRRKVRRRCVAVAGGECIVIIRVV